MYKKFFSIVVPVYNCEKNIKRCLDSIIMQRYKNFEVYIIDDGSTDRSGEICDEYSKNDLRIEVIHKHNEGVSAARQEGIKKSNGEYICFIDSDDEYESDFLEKIKEALDKNKSDIVMVGYKKLFTHNSIIKYEEMVKPSNCYWNNVHEIQRKIIPLFSNMSIAPLWNKAYRRELLLEEKMEEMKTGEDYIFNMKILEKTNSISCIDCCLYRYYRPNDEITRVNMLLFEFLDDYINMHKQTYHLLFDVWNIVPQDILEEKIDDLMYGLYQGILLKKILDRDCDQRVKLYIKNFWIDKSIRNSRSATIKERIYKYLVRKKFLTIIRILSIKWENKNG